MYQGFRDRLKVQYRFTPPASPQQPEIAVPASYDASREPEMLRNVEASGPVEPSRGRAISPQSLANLRKFSSGTSGNPAGRAHESILAGTIGKKLLRMSPKRMQRFAVELRESARAGSVRAERFLAAIEGKTP